MTALARAEMNVTVELKCAAYVRNMTAAQILAKIQIEVMPRLESALNTLAFEKRIEAAVSEKTGRVGRHEAIAVYEMQVQTFEQMLAEWEFRLAARLAAGR